MIYIYHNPRCRKSRNGLEIIEQSGKPFEIIKYLEDIPSKTELQEVLEILDIPAEELIRKNEAIWKERYRGKTLTNDEIINAMVKYPKLIERPIVIHGTKAVIGRPPENIKAIL